MKKIIGIAVMIVGFILIDSIAFDNNLPLIDLFLEITVDIMGVVAFLTGYDLYKNKK